VSSLHEPGIRRSGVSDLPELARVPALRAKLGSEAALSTFTAMQSTLVSGFLDRHVKDLPSKFPSRVLATYPDLIVQDLSWLRRRVREELR
jgi:hypothetical protein